MPVKSYLALSFPGRKEDLIKALQRLKQCDIIPAENEDVLALVTETRNEREEDLLKEKLNAIASLKLLSLVSGFTIPEN
ncbi:hypothetical protein U1E44_16295 [Arenibacter sp. GZD96]|uniref:hypothetical protein n=1 Tax=Aurantibrevibacter litoralis TaxID=3106030 RepID=UPI002AFEDC85|nr:hypothetical protein [Arenibacter sp. GZD-96]MEA1787663.1 hypothetical protein [Arenibacter sp. GZD-96]